MQMECKRFILTLTKQFVKFAKNNPPSPKNFLEIIGAHSIFPKWMLKVYKNYVPYLGDVW